MTTLWNAVNSFADWLTRSTWNASLAGLLLAAVLIGIFSYLGRRQ